MSVQILDCTLRDGAYLTDKYFGDTFIHGIVNGLVRAKTDVIEIGFLQNDGFGEGKTIFSNSSEAARFVPAQKNNSRFAVLADYSRYDFENLDTNDGNSFDIVRICFFKNERADCVKACEKVLSKGFSVFMQPVDVLGYTDIELIQMIESFNHLDIEGFSIVDTFGSLYIDDLQHIYSLVNHNLKSSVKIGFHSHNNLQMSGALSQEFIRMSMNQRDVVVDTTIMGMGRGAGNTPTELVIQYMNKKQNADYDLDEILDLIDTFIDNLKMRCSWGYGMPTFVAGCHSSHVNNVSYLLNKFAINSKDMNHILDSLSVEERKRYDYDLLETEYLNQVLKPFDDQEYFDKLSENLSGQNVLMIAPGHSAVAELETIKKYVAENNAKIILINFADSQFGQDYIFISNIKRYNYWMNDERFVNSPKILTPNIIYRTDNDVLISFERMGKNGENFPQNSSVMLMWLLDKLNIKSLAIAGFDGYDTQNSNKSHYLIPSMDKTENYENATEKNNAIAKLLSYYKENRKSEYPVRFITKSEFSGLF